MGVVGTVLFVNLVFGVLVPVVNFLFTLAIYSCLGMVATLVIVKARRRLPDDRQYQDE